MAVAVVVDGECNGTVSLCTGRQSHALQHCCTSEASAAGHSDTSVPASVRPPLLAAAGLRCSVFTQHLAHCIAMCGLMLPCVSYSVVSAMLPCWFRQPASEPAAWYRMCARCLAQVPTTPGPPGCGFRFARLTLLFWMLTQLTPYVHCRRRMNRTAKCGGTPPRGHTFAHWPG